MKRITEPELMLDDDQARAYAAADFESAHSRYPLVFDKLFPDRQRKALVLDIGCGPCDVTLRFAKANPGYRFHAMDGSAAMLKCAPRSRRIKLIHGYIPGVNLPAKQYDVILSTSLLHHLPDPSVLWQTIRQHAKPGTLVFVVDLRRPATLAIAKALTKKYTTGEPEILRFDFYNSLLAAFTPAEVLRQLRAARIPGLTVRSISDRHLLVAGEWSGVHKL